MIAVIADDITGAAELGGIGLRYGLSVEVNMDVNLSTKADLLVIAADTRSMRQKEAVEEMERITRQLAALQPEWIYKKVDSVLRGHVVAEIGIQLKVLALKSALLIPANPLLGRTIQDGHYFLNGEPVHKSSFATDPEFAISSSDVLDMLRAADTSEPVPIPVHVIKHSETLAESGIIVGEVQEDGDLGAWARIAGLTGEPGLLVGASGFFTALLRERRKQVTVNRTPASSGYPVLFVSGTKFANNQAFIRGLHAAGEPVSYLPAGGVEKEISETIINDLMDGGKAIVAIGGVAPGDPVETAHMLRGRMAQLVSKVLAGAIVQELIIEGGATAYAILEQAGLRAFYPEEELAPGVVRMRVEKRHPFYVTVKPGSYEWPASTRP